MLIFLSVLLTTVVMTAHVYYFINHPAVANRLFSWLMSKLDIFWWVTYLLAGFVVLAVLGLVLPFTTAAVINLAIMIAVVLDIRRMRANG